MPFLASAESNLVNSGPATARLNFSITIPKVLFLGVGTGATTTPPANNTNIDTVSFDFTSSASSVGNGTPLASATVPVRVIGNNGQITLIASTMGPLTNGGSNPDFISWSEITATSDQATLPSPSIPPSGNGMAVNVTANAGKVTNRSANWSFSYANSALVAPGTYGGTTINGQVTYTASMP